MDAADDLPAGLLPFLLHPACLYGPTVLDRPSSVPRLAGVYAWYFTEAPPGVPIEGCHCALDHTLLYVGIAPKETRGAATKPSERTLHCRLSDHFRGNAEGSTLRLTLGCLLSDKLGIQLRRVGGGRRFTFTNTGGFCQLLGLLWSTFGCGAYHFKQLPEYRAPWLSGACSEGAG
jgi:hypothetical protein